MRDDKRRVCQQLYFIGALPLQKHSTLPDIESSDVGTERLKEVRVLCVQVFKRFDNDVRYWPVAQRSSDQGTKGTLTWHEIRVKQRISEIKHALFWAISMQNPMTGKAPGTTLIDANGWKNSSYPRLGWKGKWQESPAFDIFLLECPAKFL